MYLYLTLAVVKFPGLEAYWNNHWLYNPEFLIRLYCNVVRACVEVCVCAQQCVFL